MKRKLSAILMSLVMAFSMVTPAWADELPEGKETAVQETTASGDETVSDETAQETADNSGFDAGVIVIPEGTDVSVSEDGTTVTIGQATDIEEGDTFVIYLDTLPVAYVAEYVSYVDGVTTITAVKAEDSVYEDVEESGSLELTSENSEFIPSESLQLLSADAGLMLASTGSTETTEATDAPFTYEDGTLTYRVTSGTGQILKGKIYNLALEHSIEEDGASMALKGNWSLEFDLTTEGTGIGDASSELDLGEIRVYGIGTIKVSITLQATADMTGTISGSFKIGLKAMNDGTVSTIREFNTNSSPDLSISAKLEGGIKISAGLDILVMHGDVYGKIGLTSQIKTAYHTVNAGEDNERTEVCTDVRAYAYLKLGAEVKYNRNGMEITLADASLVDLNEDTSPCVIHAHFEDGNKVNNCGYDMTVTDPTFNNIESIDVSMLIDTDTRVLNAAVTLPYDLELEELEIQEDGNLTIDGCDLIIDGDLRLSGGTLTVGSNATLTVKGNVYADSGSLNLTGIVNSAAVGVMTVEGIMTTASGASLELNNAGEIHSGTEWIMNGTHLEGYGYVYAGGHKITTNGSVASTNRIDLEKGTLAASGDFIIENTNTNFYEVLDLDGGTAVISGNLYNYGGLLVNGGQMTVKGDYISANDATAGDGVQAWSSCRGILQMTTASDLLEVYGDCIIYHYHYNNYDGTWSLTDGTLKLHGNFGQYGADTTNGISSSDNFKVVLTSGQHLIHAESMLTSIANLEAESGANIICDSYLRVGKLQSDLTFTSKNCSLLGMDQNGYDVTVEGDLGYATDVSNTSGYFDAWNLNGGDVKINGDLTHLIGQLTVNGGSLSVSGDYICGTMTSNGDGSITWGRQGTAAFVMNSDVDLIDISGDFTVYDNLDSGISAGTIRVGGNVSVVGTNTKYPMTMGGTSALILSGKGQKITVENESTVFRNVKTENSEILSWTGYMTALGMQSDLTISGTDLTVRCVDQTQHDLTINGDITFKSIGNSKGDEYDTWDVDGGKAYVNGNMNHLTGTINLNGGQMKLSGDYTAATVTEAGDGTKTYGGTAAKVVMAEDADVFDIAGSMYMFVSSTGWYTGITAGQLRLGGDFIEEGCGYKYQTNGTARVVLTSGSHRIHITETGTYFAELEAEEGATVICDGYLNAHTLGSDLTVVSEGMTLVDMDQKQHTLTIDGDVIFGGSTWNLNGGSVIIDGSLNQTSGTINLNGGQLKTSGDYILATVTTAGDGSVTYGSISTGFTMTVAADVLDIGGDLITYTNAQYTAPTAGMVYLGGNLKALGKYSGLRTSGTCKVVFTAGKNHHVDLESANTNFIYLLMEDGAVLTYNGTLNIGKLLADCTVYSDVMTLTALDQNGYKFTVYGKFLLTGTWDLDGGEAVVNGDLQQTSGTLKINGGDLTVNGDFITAEVTTSGSDTPTYSAVTATFNMSDPQDEVHINGDLVIDLSNSSSFTLTKGKLYISGDVYQFGKAFTMSSDHETILNGTEPQTITFDNSSSKFNNLTLSQARSEYTFSTDNCWNTIEYETECLHKATSQVTVPAGCKTDGAVNTVCDRCGEIVDKTVIPGWDSVTIDEAIWIYTGEAVEPKVSVKDVNGDDISTDDYTVNYVDNTEIGYAGVLVQFCGNYSGYEYLKFTIKPAKVSGLLASADTEGTVGICLTWEKNDSASGYQIYRKGADETAYTKVAYVESCTYDDKNVTVGESYSYRVCAVTEVSDEISVKGTLSDEVSKACECAHEKTAEKIIPASKKQNGSVTVVCDRCGAVISAEEIVGWSAASLSTASWVYTGEAVEPTVSVRDKNGNVIGAEYYTVTYDGNTEIGYAAAFVEFTGRYSGAVCLRYIIKPASVTGLTVSDASGTVELTWNAVDCASGYQVYRRAEGETGYTLLKTISEASYTDEDVETGKEYTYKIRVLTDVEDGITVKGSFSEEVQVKTGEKEEEVRHGWIQQDNGSWVYYDENGQVTTGWKNIDSVWYYMDSNGVRQTGWHQIGGLWYYFGADGKMSVGWQQIGGTWYYFTAGGDMVTGWRQIGSTWYYFNGSGAMATGWRQIGTTWYYFSAGGAMQTGWQQIGGKYYYFTASGAMASNTWIGNYYVDASGVWTTSK